MIPSLQSRLAWRLALVFAAVILATSLALFFHRRGVDTEIPTDTLARIIDHVVAGLSRGPDGAPRLELDEDDGRFDYAIVGDDGRALLASANPPAPIPAGDWPEGYLRRHGRAGDRIAAFKAWNRLRSTIPGWPDIELAPPPRKRQPWTLPLSRFPESLQAEVEHWATGVSNPDPFDPNAPARPLRPASVKVRRFQIQELASALVRQGLPIQDISSLAFLVDVANFKLGLRFLIDRFGGSTEAIHHLAVGIKAIARYHVKVNEPQLREIQGICKRLKVETNGIREKNRIRLHQLDDPANLGKLLHLPAELARLSCQPRLRAHRAALLMQAAVAIEILIYAPMRLGNLAALNLERHLRPLSGGKEKKMQILIPGGEVKNGRALHYELGGGSTRLFELYVRDFRPTLLRDPSRYLFPAQDGGAKRTGALGEIIKSAIRTHTGLIINPHLFRSIAGKIHSLAAPGDFATLSHVIGDSLATAMKSYAQFEQQSSLAHYQRSVDSARAQLVGKVERKPRSP